MSCTIECPRCGSANVKVVNFEPVGCGDCYWTVGVPAVHVDPSERVGRNDPCPCRSGLKYKKCCLHKAAHDGGGDD